MKPNGKIRLRNESVKSSTFKFMIEHNILDRLSLFNIDANLKVSFLGGLIEVYKDTIQFILIQIPAPCQTY